MQHDDFERRVARALAAPVPASATATRQRILARVRAIPADERPRHRRHWIRRGHFRASIAGAALAAGLGSIGMLPALSARTGPGAHATHGIAAIGDTVSATLRDTMRIVRLILVAPASRDEALAGSLQGGMADSAPDARAGITSRWAAAIARHDREPRFAVVVDGARPTLDRALMLPADGHERLRTLLRVVPVAN